ncbi:MAG: DEAD/DEAH box helicase family protein, partial [Bacteroidales bacterium]|nr:DEAD/DEAH box helicase family protein [Bacteroidales bacterium]
MDNQSGKIYVSVILPLKYRGEATYILPGHLATGITIGTRVKVDFSGKVYSACIKSISTVVGPNVSSCKYQNCFNKVNDFNKENNPNNEINLNKEIVCSEEIVLNKEIEYKEIIGVEPFEPVSKNEIALWYKVADYYLCSVGEVYKAAYPSMSLKQERVKSRKNAASLFEALSKEGSAFHSPQLSEKQREALEAIKASFSPLQCDCENVAAKPVLLHGVTGGGKTEIYITLAIEELQQGRSVLYMAPEIAITKQLQMRLKKVFGSRLLVYHSKQSAVEKKFIRQVLTESAAAKEPVVILGTRSALFLPYRNLGLVLVDEEHDSSYKQTEPAPRYQARDVAIMLANIHKSNILLGSATPSFESEYNSIIGRFAKVSLKERYYGACSPKVEIVDTIWARRSGQMRGNFSQK